MEQRRRSTTVEQLNLLLDFLEQNKDIALGRMRSKEAIALSARLWRECSLRLNSKGPARTGKEWAKVWNDLKCRVRAKLVSINARHQATGGSPSTSTPLTRLERKIAIIMGRDVGPLPHVRQQDPLAFENNTDENYSEEIKNILGSIDPDVQVEFVIHEASGSAGPRRSVVAPEGVSLSPRVALSPPPPPAQFNRNESDESRKTALKIEQMRAEAALINAQANKTMAEGFKLLAEVMDRFMRQYPAKQPDAS